MAFPQHDIRTNEAASTGKSSKQTQHVSASLCGVDGEVEGAVVEEDGVVVVVSFFFKPSSLHSFVLHFVAFNSSSCCGGSGEEDVAVVVVAVEVALVVVVVVVVVVVFPSLASSSSFLFGTGSFLTAAAACLIFLHSFRCSPSFQWFTWQSRPQYCTVWHNLQGCNGRNGVLGLPHVEQQRMVGVVLPSSLSNV